MKTITYNAYAAFLRSLGLEIIREDDGHDKWNRLTGEALKRPIVTRPKDKNIPVLHLIENRKTLVRSGIFADNKAHDEALSKF
jgi:hypothetical protein